MHNTRKNDSYDRKITKELFIFINMDNEENIKNRP